MVIRETVNASNHLANILLNTLYVVHDLIVISSSLEEANVLRVSPISSSSILTVECYAYENFKMTHATVLDINRIPYKSMDP